MDVLISGLTDILQNILRVLMSVTLVDIVDILLLTVAIHMIYIFIKDNRAQQLLKGIILLVGLYGVAYVLQLKVMSFLLQNFFQVGIIAIVIVFQPEVRRMLEKMGNTKVVNDDNVKNDAIDEQADAAREQAIKGIAEGCDVLRRTKTGALVVVECGTKIGDDIIEKGKRIEAVPSAALFSNLFYDGAPMHDGALIIRDNKMYAAGCVLPLTTKTVADKYGTRHRAAIGMSENCSDAVVIVVSEERGVISVAVDGKLREYNKRTLERLLREKMPKSASKADKKIKRIMSQPKSGGKG